MWRIKESILEFKLTYIGERLFNESLIKSIYKSTKAMIKCFIILLKPNDIKYMEFWAIGVVKQWLKLN